MLWYSLWPWESRINISQQMVLFYVVYIFVGIFLFVILQNKYKAIFYYCKNTEELGEEILSIKLLGKLNSIMNVKDNQHED
jgi:hypothetical protein